MPSSMHEEVVLQVKNRPYKLTIDVEMSDVLNLTLTPEGPHADSDCWKSSFNSHYIEQVTQKTGNFKKFHVFVEMLIAALQSEGNAVVTLDLLTQSEVDQMRSASSFSHQNFKNTNGLDGQEKVYLLLIYSVAFDRVLYPLVLKRVRPSQVRQIIPQSPSTHSLAGDFNSQNQNGDVVISRRERDILLENLRLKREIESLIGERTTVERAFNQLRSETSNQFETIKHELCQLNEHNGISADEKQLVTVQMDKCYALIEQLLDELKQTQIEKQKLQFERDATVNALRKELQEVKNELLTRSTVSSRQRSLSSSSIRTSGTPQTNRTASHNTSSNRLKKSASIESISIAGRQHQQTLAKPTPTRGRSLSIRRPQPVKRDSSVGSTASTSSNQSTTSKRFDPTAYVRERQEKLQRRQSLTRNSTSTATPKTLAKQSAIAVRPSPSQYHQPDENLRRGHELKRNMQSKSVDERLHLLTTYFQQLKQVR